jgi:hypothetical protein
VAWQQHTSTNENAEEATATVAKSQQTAHAQKIKETCPFFANQDKFLF